MTFALYALLGPDSPELSSDSLAADLRALFGEEDNFSVEVERLPFAKGPTLALRWGAWLARVSYEEGERVVEDSRFIQHTVGGSAPFDLSVISRRIRVVFGDDDERVHTNQMIFLVDYLQAIDGVVLFDPQQAELMRPRNR